jgi:hypothetical protein
MRRPTNPQIPCFNPLKPNDRPNSYLSEWPAKLILDSIVVTVFDQEIKYEASTYILPSQALC